MQAKNINEVISIIDSIIIESKTNQSPLGYFAALYKKVTVQVKEGIESGSFEDGVRMEKLDVIFANRYLHAYFAYQKNETITNSWQKVFDASTRYWPIVLQHLLLGMNVHISLDLGIAAAEVTKNENISTLEGDFNKINEILSSLVNEVENDLAQIWPTLKVILKWTRKVDNFLVDFSMELARNGAWGFAKAIHEAAAENQALLIKERDEKISKRANLIINTGFIGNMIFGIIRLGERGSVADKIAVL